MCDGAVLAGASWPAAAVGSSAAPSTAVSVSHKATRLASHLVPARPASVGGVNRGERHTRRSIRAGVARGQCLLLRHLVAAVRQQTFGFEYLYGSVRAWQGNLTTTKRHWRPGLRSFGFPLTCFSVGQC